MDWESRSEVLFGWVELIGSEVVVVSGRVFVWAICCLVIFRGTNVTKFCCDACPFQGDVVY